MSKPNELLQKTLKHLEVAGFLKAITKNGVVKSFRFGPSGELLFETIKREWIYSNVIYRDHNCFTFNSNGNDKFVPDIRDAFLSAKTLVNSELPFALAETGKLTFTQKQSELYSPETFTPLRHFTFLGPSEAEQFFYRFQQERKRWWRKLTPDPGKIKFAEVENNDGSSELTAKIISEFYWGTSTLETIKYFGLKPFENLNADDQTVFTVKSLKKKCLPHVVMSGINLDYAAFCYLIDAFSVKKGKVIMRFHRKMAPIKFAFAADVGDEDDINNLFGIAELIGLGLRKAGLFCLLPVPSEFGKKKLDYQLNKADALGVPYTIVLTKETLDTGIFGLYSRDTTLQEQVHISKFPHYGELLMKNF